MPQQQLMNTCLPPQIRTKLLTKAFDSRSNLLHSPQLIEMVVREGLTLPRTDQLSSLLSILHRLSLHRANSLMLWLYDRGQNHLLNEIVQRAYHIMSNQDEMQALVNAIDAVLAMYEPRLKNVQCLTQLLGYQFHTEQFNVVQLKFTHQLLLSYLRCKRSMECLFFTTGQTPISCTPKLTIFNEGYVVTMNILLLDSEQKEEISLCVVHSNIEVVAVTLHKHLTICNETTDVEYSIPQYQFQKDIWYRIQLHIGELECIVRVNKVQILRKNTILKKNKQRSIKECRFCQGMVGFIMQIIVGDKVVDEIKNWDDVQKQANKGILIGIFPFSTYQNLAFNPYMQINSYLGDAVSVIDRPNFTGISPLGKLQTFIPLFYLGSFYPHTQYPQQIHILLQILTSLLIWRKSKHLDQVLPMSKKQCNMLMMLGEFLQPYAQYLTPQSISLLFSLQHHLPPCLQNTFTKYILWGNHLSKIFSQPVLLCYYDALAAHYRSKKPQITQIMRWVDKHLDRDNCCVRHLQTTATVEDGMRVSASLLPLHYEHLIYISTLLPPTHSQIEQASHFFLRRHSPCAYHMVTTFIKRHLEDGCPLNHSPIVPYLTMLADKCLDYSLFVQLIYLLLLLDHPLPSIAYLLSRFKHLVCSAPSLRKNLVQHTRKYSDTQSNITFSKRRTAFIKDVQSPLPQLWHLCTILLNFTANIVSQLQHNTALRDQLIKEERINLLNQCFMLVPSSLKLHILNRLLRVVNEDKLLFSPALNKMLTLQDKERQKVVQKIYSKLIAHVSCSKYRVSKFFALLMGMNTSEHLLSMILTECIGPHISSMEQRNVCDVLAFALRCKDCELVLKSSCRRIYAITAEGMGFSRSLDKIMTWGRVEQQKKQRKKCYVYDTEYMQSQDVTFLFDIFLSKVGAGAEATLSGEKTLQSFEIYLLAAIGGGKDRDIAAEITIMMQGYITHCIAQGDSFQNKSALRMALFLTSAYLIENSPLHLKILWKSMFHFVQDAAQVLKVSSLSQLTCALKQNNIHIFIVETITVFIFSNGMEIDTIDKLSLLLQNEEKLMQFLQCPEFRFIITLNGNWQKLVQFCLFKNKQMLNRQFPKQLPSLANYQQNEQLVIQHDFQSRELFLQQCSIRRSRATWWQTWAQLRTYNKPYGIWMAQRDNPTEFHFCKRKNKNIIFKQSLYSSSSGAYPILQAKVQQPWCAIYAARKSSPLQYTSPFFSSKQRKKKSNGRSVKMFLSKWLPTQQQRQYEVLWVKQGIKAVGKVAVEEEHLTFWYESGEQEDSHLMFQRFKLKPNEECVVEWRLEHIKQICRRRYLMSYDTLMITLVDSRSILFHFQQGQATVFLDEVRRAKEHMLKRYGGLLKANKVPLYSDTWIWQGGWQERITQAWLRKQISTLEYLLQINNFASRNIYDLSQYPVVPWVSSMLPNREPSLRDLSMTMAEIGTEERRVILRQKFQTHDPFNPVPPFFFGTHYSSPGLVFHYLVRVAPFTAYAKQLQGGKFDIPDRMFCSFISSWNSACTQISDVRELIPQFYYLPECLLNNEGHNFGRMQSKQRVEDVQLPPWAGGNPYFFVMQMRQMLQAVDISPWIDLFFGVKQRGPQAQAHFNVYYYLTYQQYSHYKDEEDEIQRTSCQAQILHFGQIPPQIFSKPHPTRTSHSTHPQLRPYAHFKFINALKQQITGINLYDHIVTIVKRSSIQIFSTIKSSMTQTRSVAVPLQRCPSQKLYQMKQGHVAYLSKGYIIIWGYLDHSFRVYHSSTGKRMAIAIFQSKIMTVLVNRQENLILIGSQNGMLHVYEIQYDKFVLQKMHVEIFPAGITHISQNGGFFAISFGRWVSLYKIERGMWYISEQRNLFIKFLRTIENNILIKSAHIVTSLLYAVVIHDNRQVKIYSINGQFIKSCDCNGKEVLIMTDEDLNQVVTIVEDDKMVCLSTPDLRCLSHFSFPSQVQQHIGPYLLAERQMWVIGCR